MEPLRIGMVRPLFVGLVPLGAVSMTFEFIVRQRIWPTLAFFAERHYCCQLAGLRRPFFCEARLNVASACDVVEPVRPNGLRNRCDQSCSGFNQLW
jgi:hypothetical protein